MSPRVQQWTKARQVSGNRSRAEGCVRKLAENERPVALAHQVCRSLVQMYLTNRGSPAAVDLIQREGLIAEVAFMGNRWYSNATNHRAIRPSAREHGARAIWLRAVRKPNADGTRTRCPQPKPLVRCRKRAG